MSPRDTGPANAIAQAMSATEDAAMQDRLSRLTGRILDEIEWQLTHAPPQVRRELIKSVVPVLFKDRDSRDADTELEEMRAEMRAMNEQMREQLQTPAVTVIDTTSRASAPVDTDLNVAKAPRLAIPPAGKDALTAKAAQVEATAKRVRAKKSKPKPKPPDASA